MGIPYAEVIGDPVEHSKSPVIHKFWLERLGIEGDYRATRVAVDELPDFLAGRREDPDWRGCNVTAPLKAEAALQVVDPTGVSGRIGAANTVFRSPLGECIAANTDLQGLSVALGAAKALGNQVCVIGAGGAARATLEFLRLRGAVEVSLIARDINRGKSIHRLSGSSGAVYPFERAAEAIANTEWLINATPLGMTGMPSMPESILNALGSDYDAFVFDMVYSPLETDLLRRARQLGRQTADGLVMLIGQAAAAFELFFGMPAPREHDAELRERLTS